MDRCDDEPRFALVTGAASGLGRAIAERLGRDGWNVAVCDVDEAGAEETVRRVQAAAGQARAIRLDVTQPDQWECVRQRLAADWPRLDLLVNNAGVGGSGDVGEVSLDDWRWILEVNLWGVIHGCHAMLPWMKAAGRGAFVVNTASVAGLACAPGMAGYNVSKAGVIALSETLAGELAPHGIGVVVLCPGFFSSGLLERGRFGLPVHRSVAKKLTRRSKISAESVAEALMRAMRRRRLYVVVPARVRWFWYAKRLCPQWMNRLVARMYNRSIARQKERARRRIERRT